MPKVSINEIVAWTGKTRATVMRKLQDLKFEDGPKQAKLCDSGTAMEAIYGRGIESVKEGEEGVEFISNSEANRQLTIARKAQIDLEMEVTRNERPLLSDVLDEVQAVFDDIAGIIKGSDLSEDRKSDVMERLKLGKEAIAG